MATVVIDIVNRARTRVGLGDISSADFMNSLEAEPRQQRQMFNDLYKQIVESESEDLVGNHVITTVVGQRLYPLPFETRFISSDKAMILDGNRKRLLIYRESPDHIQRLYPDFDYPEGNITNWYIDPDTRDLAFFYVPNEITRIQFRAVGNQYTITADDTTACSDLGDNFIYYSMIYFIYKDRQMPLGEVGSTAEEQASIAWTRYCSKNNYRLSNTERPDFTFRP
jgi:hypothetical protein